MGKKAKVGKNRKDIFYKRAKEAGYRARSAYKLIQLNKKYNFLQTSRVCIDLCAAPGSWMQVAAKFMPVSSVIIGVDRYAIASIPNTISIQGDITTEKIRQDLKGNLKTWKADLVLHDGAPHVGQNWLHDAYQQNLLVLHAFKLACEFLQKGGTFLTKVFRSKDHFSLEYVFRKLFKRVETTKPIASRFASAEIFIVCLGYLAPDKVDPEFFDPKFVFQTLEAEPANKINIMKPEKTKQKAHGYEEGITMLFKKNSIAQFIATSRFIEMLEETNEFEWDCPAARNSSHTTGEIIESCKDIKLLGRKELKALLNWRKAVKAELEAAESKPAVEEKEDKEEEEKEESDEVDEEIEELQKIQEQVALLNADKAREEKQHKRKVEKKKKKLEEKLNLRLMVPGDPGPQEMKNDGLFTINALDFTNALEDVIDQNTEILAESEDEFSDTEKKRSKHEFYSKSGTYLDKTGSYHKRGAESETENESDNDSDAEGLNLDKIELKEQKKKKSVRFADNDADFEDEEDDDTRKRNPITTDLVGDSMIDKRERKAENWFSNDIFDELDTEEVEDYEIESAIKKHQLSGGTILQKHKEVVESKEEGNESGYTSGSSDVVKKDKKEKRKRKSSSYLANDAPDSNSDSDSDSESESDSAADVDYEANDDEEDLDAGNVDKTGSAIIDTDVEEAPKKKNKKDIKLTPVGLALATKMIRSKKAKRDLYNDGWNRYMYGDEDLPEWFEADERAHNNPKLIVNSRDLKMYMDRNKPVDARTIKKVVEAKARKQRRMKKKIARARKKAEVIVNSEDMNAREKALEMKKIYKKVTATKPKEKTYVVMKKQYSGKKPKGTKGPVKMVDRRMKKDKRAKGVQQSKRTKRR